MRTRILLPALLFLAALTAGCVTGSGQSQAPLPDLDAAPSVAERLDEVPAGRPQALIGGLAAPARRQVVLPAPPRLRGGVGYAPPPKYAVPAAGQYHFFGFVVTPEYAEASRAYLAGDGQGALAALDRVASQPGIAPALAWRAAHERVLAQLLLGGGARVEAGLAETERLELALCGLNLSTRALRAEVRYWAGDLDGALADAAQVAQALGHWRLPVEFGGPPGDMHKLAVRATARIRSAALLGMVLSAQGRHQEALPWLEYADELLNDVFYIRNHERYGSYFPAYPEAFYGRGLSLAMLGAGLTALGRDPERAAQAFERSAAYFKAAGFAAGDSLHLGLKAAGEAAAGRMDLAAATASQGLAVSAALDLPDQAWRLLALRGRALAALGRMQEAEESLRQAQEAADLMAGTMTPDSARARAVAGLDDITRGLTDIDAARGDLEALYADLERGRARSFVALLAHRALDAGREPELTARLRALDAAILAERRRGLWSGPGAGRESALLAERRTLAESLARRDPDLGQALSVQASTLARARAALGPGQALAYALPAGPGGALRLLWVTPGGVDLVRLELTAEGLRGCLEAFARARGAGSAAGEAAALAPLAAALGLERRSAPAGLFVVPSGDWHFVPWGALAPPFPVAALPAGGFVERRAGAALMPNQGARTALVGDPAFGGLLPQLPGALAEANEVARLYGTTALTGPQATEAALRRAVGGGVDVLHLATHALFDPGQPLKSALFLSTGQKAQALTLERLYAVPLKSRLAVLSACETGLGGVAAGEDLVGLARGFYLAGARVLLSSLYAVDDEHTRLFMAEFYRRLGAEGPGRAWLSAVRAVRAAGAPPSSQGAFVLGGGL